MWVRIDELSFAHGCADEVINHIRDSAVTRHHGESLRGFRLLVDRVNDRALDVSYWDSEDDARADDEDAEADPTEPAKTSVVRTELYEMAIDAVLSQDNRDPARHGCGAGAAADPSPGALVRGKQADGSPTVPSTVTVTLPTF